MASNRHRPHLAASRTHKGLALIIGTQLPIWFASGPPMSVLPIDEVHGDHLVDRKTVTSLPADATYADPALDLKTADAVMLRMLHGRPVAEVMPASIESSPEAKNIPSRFRAREDCGETACNVPKLPPSVDLFSINYRVWALDQSET